jgi:outer dense fiber protein 2
VTELRAQSDQLKDENVRMSRKKVQCETEITRLQSQIEELQQITETSKETLKLQIAGQAEENERLKALVRTMERQKETSDHEAERTAQQKERELERVRQQAQLETERVQFQLQQKLGELEPLPELLKNSEMRLQDTQERITVYERKCSEQTQLIADLTVKVESQSQQLESLREKYHSMMDENRSLAAQAETATRKTVETDQHNRELVSLAAKKEESLQRAMNRIEDLGHENASLKRQVDTALDETKRQRDDVKERAAMKVWLV